MRELYFAYGSNLDLEGKLRAWAPSAELFDIGFVAERRLAFTRRSERWGARAADILPASGHHAWGALFSVDSGDVDGIDRCEGAPRNYRRIGVEVSGARTVHRAFSYEVVDRHLPDRAPATDYLATVIRGAERVGLPGTWVAHLRSLGSLPNT